MNATLSPTGPGHPSDNPIQRRHDRSCLPLSFGQQRLWIQHRLEPELGLNNRTLAFRLAGALDVTALAGSLGAAMQRHEVLRSRFQDPAGEVGFALAGHPDFVVDDLQDLAPAQRAAEALGRAVHEARRPFDLASDPLVRARVLRLGPREHWLVATLHHIVSDGWSDAILWRETTAAYEALHRGAALRLPELPLQFADFAVWQRDLLEEPVLKGELAFWKERLETCAPTLSLPFDRPRGPSQSYAGGEERLSLPAALVDSLERMARSQGATLFMALLAGFSALLSRYSGERSLVIGCPVAGRPRCEVEGLVGPFANQLALPVDLTGDPGFGELLRRVRATVLSALSRPDLPFGLLVDALRPRFGQPYAPIFQVAMNWRGFEAPAFMPHGLATAPVAVPRQYSRLDVTLEGRRVEGGVELLAEYCAGLFDAATILRMLGHLTNLLEHAASAPDTRVSKLRLMSDSERRQVTAGFHGELRVSGESGIHELFQEQVRRAPKADAVRSEEHTLSYAELDAWSDRVASLIAGRGIGPGSRVGLFLDRSAGLLAGLMGVLRTGATYVPLDPAYPEDRLRFMAEDADLAAILTEESLFERVPAGSRKALLIEEATTTTRDPGATRRVGAQDVAYVVYTSGSTGRPKGVVTPHGAVVNFLEAMRGQLRVDPSDVFAARTSLCFDPSVLELLLPLVSGACVEIVGRELGRDGVALSRLLRERRATLFQATPVVFHMLLDAGWTGAPGLKLLCGGEVLSPTLADRLLRCGSELWNDYGPTDTTVWCSAGRYAGGRITVGRPIPNVRLYVLDTLGEPVPIGVPGEVHIAGDSLAQGYLGRPDRTAEGFAPDGFAADPGERCYRSGDVGRFMPDGRLELLGRLDQQVKLRGFRIEPGEVEAALQSLPQVANAAVAVRGQAQDARLVAYVVPRSESSGAPPVDLRRDLARLLPDYMVPAAFVPLKALPLTPTGKLDRRRLPDPGSLPAAPVPRLAPRDALETALASLFTTVLDVPVGICDDFFELGGQSLRAARLFHLVHEQLGVELSPETILEAPTVSALASLLRGKTRPSTNPTLVRLKRGDGAPVFFVHGIGGGVLIYRPLAANLGQQTAAWALQPPRRPGPARSLETIAAEYVQELRTVQAQGPFRLAGLSFGGLVACEMARQLTAAGDEVSFLAVFDSWGPGYPRFPWIGARALAHLENIVGLPWSEKAPYVRLRLAGLPHWLRRAATRAARQVAGTLGRRPPALVQAVEGALLWAVREYREQHPCAYPGKLLLFRAREQPVGCRHDPTNGWGPVVGELEVHEVAGGHESLLYEPQVHAWAPLFRRLLEGS